MAWMAGRSMRGAAREKTVLLPKPESKKYRGVFLLRVILDTKILVRKIYN